MSPQTECGDNTLRETVLFSQDSWISSHKDFRIWVFQRTQGLGFTDIGQLDGFTQEYGRFFGRWTGFSIRMLDLC
jgi:hypothetical protein